MAFTQTAFSKVLIANRGEIALRVMRTLREQGMRSVAIYSDVDAEAPHVAYADEAIAIGGAQPSESYLLGDKVIQAALSSGAQAIHPGYGFLSENAEFAAAVEAAGLVFIGPPVEAIKVMGDKAISKRAMIAAGVPCVPGYQDEDQSEARLIAEADNIGFPLMVKAAAGGGGRGMRLVHSAGGVEAAIKTARSEALNAFGSDELILEKAIIRPRHVEIQVFADCQGNTIYLGERDCSVQRRHQKVVEEAPCPVMTPELREKMGRAAVEAAKAVHYVGAGTVEFLLDESGEFYFLEMNTRLQVEHPVTEMITGLDLVSLQLHVAQGQPLPLTQQQVRLQGHAIEVRLYAEDPADDFLPSTGRVQRWRIPHGEGVRVDAGIADGSEVSPFYDSMVAKVIAYGDNREQARLRLCNALEDTALVGPKNNKDFLLETLQRPQFIAGEATTAFIEEEFPDGVAAVSPTVKDFSAIALLQSLLARQQAADKALHMPEELLNWSSTGTLDSVYSYEVEGEKQTYEVVAKGSTHYVVTYQSEAHQREALEMTVVSLEQESVCFDSNGQRWSAAYFSTGSHNSSDDELYVNVQGLGQVVVNNIAGKSAAQLDQGGGSQIVAPMHGVVVSVDVQEGDSVKPGDTLVILEAMKMQHAIHAKIAGTVGRIVESAGAQVATDALLIEITPDAE